MGKLEAGTVIEGQYRLDEPLNKGGMGEVWRGHHLRLDIPIAIKLMRPALVADPSASARFEREAKAAAQLRSPHVVQIYDHGVFEGWPYIVMELLEGKDLRAHLKRTKTPPLEEVVRICDEVCKALGRAHSAGVVHRDLKPANIFLSEPDEGLVKILDFGIAKETGGQRVVEGELTSTGQLLGSPHYMSPEQARGLELDGRSDLWSLAVILFRMLTGERPFTGRDVGDIIVRICMDPVPVASEVNPDLPPLLDDFFERAFEREPTARFPTAADFAAEFRKAAGLAARSESGTWSSVSGDTTSVEGDGTSSERFARALQPTTDPGDTFTNVEREPRGRTTLFAGVAAIVLGFGLVTLFVFRDGPAQSGERAAAPLGETSSPTPASAPGTASAVAPTVPSSSAEAAPLASAPDTPASADAAADSTARDEKTAPAAPPVVAPPPPRRIPRRPSVPTPPPPAPDLGY